MSGEAGGPDHGRQKTHGTAVASGVFHAPMLPSTVILLRPRQPCRVPLVQEQAGGTNQDQEHLRLLEIFHYVLAGLQALIGLFPIFHVGMGIAMLTGYFPMGPRPPSGAPFAMPDVMGWMFVGIGGSIILFYETLAILTLTAGRSIAARRRHTFCLIAAAIGCLNMPMGTLLGVFTFIVLLRPSVKPLFDAQA